MEHLLLLLYINALREAKGDMFFKLIDNKNTS